MINVNVFLAVNFKECIDFSKLCKYTVRHVIYVPAERWTGSVVLRRNVNLQPIAFIVVQQN